MKYIEYEDYEKAISIIERSIKYIKLAHDDAESKHDTYREYYMDSVQYEIMNETDGLLKESEEIVTGNSD